VVLLAAPPPASAAVPVVVASLVQNISTAAMNPPFPDPDGVTYLTDRDHLLLADSEVDEMSIFQNTNLLETTRTGVVVDRGVTTAYSHEPAGISYDPANAHVFISDDDQFRVHEITAGADARYGTADDGHTMISTAAFGSTDPEDVTYFPPTGELFVLDGADNDVHRVSPGPNGRFDGVPPTGDDTAVEFDVQRYGAEDPEGIGYHPGRGTLVVVDSTSERIYEFNRDLQLIDEIDIAASHQVFAGGVAVAPASDNPSRWDFWVVDRGIDNNTNPNENDGRLYELRADLPPIGNLAPVVDAGRDAPAEIGTPIALRATVYDDGGPGPSTLQWSQVSGPGTTTFTPPSAAQTSASFSATGTYVLRATASDGQLSTSDDVTITVVARGAPRPLDTPVAKAFDDVEQRPTGFADWLGATLNIPNAGTTSQTIGIRFARLAVPPGATITEAWIQFAATGSTSTAASIQVRAVAADDTPTFTTSSTTVSSRPQTSTSVAWSPPAWTSGQRGAAQRTPDLKTLVQAVVGRAGWRSDNALAFVMTGTGERRASSHDGSIAPVLHVAYTMPAQQDTPPTAAFTSSCDSLACGFDGTASSDADGPIASYQWNFGDGGTASGATPSHSYAAPGTYGVTLVVTDGAGHTGTVSHDVTVGSTSAAIAFRGVAVSNANTTAAAVTVPAVRAGDAMLLFATLNVTTLTVTPPAGWTQLADFVTGSERTIAWQRVATAADAGSRVTVGLSGYAKTALQLVAYGGTSSTPVAAIATGGDAANTLTHPTPSAPVAGPGRWVVSYWADKSSATTDWQPPGGVAVRNETIGSSGGHIDALVADGGAPAPQGASPSLTASTDAASRAATITVVLQPG
jgi:PKD repeat protein